MRDLFDLTAKVAIVTGGNGGIGRAIALGLAQHGADIVVAARNEHKTAAVVSEVEAMGRRGIGVRCDVLQHEDITATVDTAVRELGGVKAGVWNLTRTMALDWAGDNIQVNLIAPGWIRTEMTDPVWEDTERTAYIIDETPAGRLGEPEDLTGTGIFLASAASDFITGTYIRPAGGSGVGDKAWPRP